MLGLGGGGVWWGRGLMKFDIVYEVEVCIEKT